jgi:beta-lactam-binding protein with PASTA domain
MRQVFRYILLSLVLVTVFLVSALTSMRLGIHGREAAVPNLTGMTPAEAERVVLASGLLLEVEGRFYSAKIAEGHILSQVPAAGSKVRRGWKIRVAESLGPQRVVIPNVVGQSQRVAEINLAQRGLQLNSLAIVHLPDLPAERVIAQSPPPNAEGVAAPKVNVLLTAPTVAKPESYVMPDFVGQRYGDATSAITIGNFKLGTVKITLQADSPLADEKTSKLKPIATDRIISQSPAAGQKIVAGATISFELLR